ncbi:MAG: ABC transporter ATP-binding protein [Clostridiales Family XIII bacterium]|jgi:ABC-2 type transport system ATP-binding protein|nr:ABC transporter ATP-binding protein [Clostridiales Family XIII bacterium]
MSDTNYDTDKYVEVMQLTKRYGETLAVDNLSFSVAKGEIFGFLGPNGAGKSTTLNILSTLLDYNNGHVKVAGYDLAHEAKQIKEMIGLVPQDIAIYDILTAYENVAFFASLYGLRGKELKEKTLAALEFVGLKEQQKMRAAKMSGGMKRRLNIACGIAHEPKLIVMDEPTVGVDAQSRELIMNSIRTLKERGATIIYTSHYMPEVQEICDRIAIIDKGRLAAIGTKEELLAIVTDVKTVTIAISQSSAQNQEQTLSDRITHATNKLKDMPDVKNVIFNPENHTLDIDVDIRHSDITLILSVLMAENLSILDVQSESANLETTFLALTGRELR